MFMIFLLLIFFFCPFPVGGIPAADAVKWPAEPDMSQLWISGKLRADVSNAQEGYFLAGLTGTSSHKMKLRVTKGGVTLTYDLNGKGNFEVFPFQLGSGYYDISLYENISGKKYAQAGTVALQVNLNSEDAAFYYPNQYVDYSIVTKAVADAEKLCEGKTDLEVYSILCEFMQKNFIYDYIRAATIKAGSLPDIENCYEKRMGVCQDLSAILCCMMRTMGLPAKLVIGYADKQYHAWTLTEIGGKEYFFDPTAALNAINKVKNYSVERYY